MSKGLTTPDREPATYQSVGITKIHLDEPVCFIEVTHRDMNEGLLIRAEITHK